MDGRTTSIGGPPHGHKLKLTEWLTRIDHK
jgi:hypothetical protein